MEVFAQLPYPSKISVNAVWKRGKRGTYLNPSVWGFREEIYYIMKGKPQFGKSLIRVEIKAFPPDKRKRDLDNILKSTLDALAHAGTFDDDSQIIQLYIEKSVVKKNGMLEIKITEPYYG